MIFTQTIDDSNIVSLAARLGWTATIPDPQNQGQQIPNPINQDQWIVNAAVKYVNNEQDAGIILPTVSAAQRQATQIAATAASLNSGIVTVPSKGSGQAQPV